MLYMIVALLFISVLLLLVGIIVSIIYKEKPTEKLKYYDEHYRRRMTIEGDKKERIGLIKRLARWVPSVSIGKARRRKLELDLIQANVAVTIEELTVIKFLTSMFGAFMGFLIAQNFIWAAVIFLIIWQVPRFVISRKKHRNRALFDEQLNDGIALISNSLKAGYSFLQALRLVAEETEDPFSREFKHLLKEMNLGLSMDESFRNLLERMDSEDLRLVVNVILIQKDIGGNLSEILENIGGTIRDRQKLRNEVKTLTAQGKLSGIIVMGLPIALALVIYIVNTEYIIVLFQTSLGRMLLGLALFNQMLGWLVIKRIINIEL